jgi:hypothetical protein
MNENDLIEVHTNTSQNKKEDNGSIVYYSDRFFFDGVGDEPGIFSASIMRVDQWCKDKELNVRVGFVGDGLSLCFFLNSDRDKTEVLKTVSKITEGFQNLLSALKREVNE